MTFENIVAKWESMYDHIKVSNSFITDKLSLNMHWPFFNDTFQSIRFKWTVFNYSLIYRDLKYLSQDIFKVVCCRCFVFMWERVNQITKYIFWLVNLEKVWDRNFNPLPHTTFLQQTTLKTLRQKSEKCP